MTVFTLLDMIDRWEQFLRVYTACEAAGLPLPSEEVIDVSGGSKDWRERNLHSALAIILDTGAPAVLFDDELITMGEALEKINDSKTRTGL
jgi:hypothetical protein